MARGRSIKYAFLIICWMSMLFLFFLPADNSFDLVINDVLDFNVLSNQIGPCSFLRYDPENDYKPLYSSSFDRLTLDNNNLGIFKSAIHQIITIDNLKLKIFGGSDHSTENILPIPADIFSDNHHPAQQISSILSTLNSKLDGWRIDNFNIGPTNVSELLVNGFEYTFIKDNHIIFAIQSKRAIASYKYPGLTLRGRVVIKTNSERILYGNYVIWDTRNNHFAVKGIYTLNTGKTVQTGQNILLDYQLNKIVSAKKMDNPQKEHGLCYARLY